jgi:Protein of unknown function (DUF3489)
VRSNQLTILPSASHGDDEAVSPISRNRKVTPGVAASPEPEKPKKGPTSNGPTTANIAAARSKPAKKVRGRPKAETAKKSSKSKPAGKPSRKAAAGSKQDSVISLLRQPEGATIDRLVKATGWQPHSVRGFLAGTVRKKLKLPLQSQKVDGKRTYRIKAGKPAATTRKSRNV